LTSNRLTSSESIDTLKSFPIVEYSLVDEYTKKYQTLLLTRSDVVQKSIKATRQNLQSMDEPDETTRETIKKISDVIWYSLLK
jgi:Menin